MSVRVQPDPAYPAGHALITVTGAAAAVGAPGFRIQRDAGWEDDKLGPRGWQGSDALLQPAGAEAVGDDLVLHVGWDVCLHLEAGVYELSVPSAGLAPVGVSWPDIAPLHAGAGSIVPPAPAPLAKSAPPRPPEPDPVPDPPPEARTEAVAATAAAPEPAAVPKVRPPVPSPPSVRQRVALTAIGFALGLLLVVGGYRYWQGRGTGETAVTEASSVAPTPDPAQAPGELDRLSVPQVLASAPNPAALTAEGERRLQSDRRDDGLLRLEAAADRADPAAAAALARLYDPVLFQPGGAIPRPDPRQAARYYRDAAQGGADVAAAREALRQNLQARGAAGDLAATLSLKDFWP